MLVDIAIFGRLLLMMGQDSRSEPLFYYFRLEDQIPENHLLRLIATAISASILCARS
jgi:hypothetical protein